MHMFLSLKIGTYYVFFAVFLSSVTGTCYVMSRSSCLLRQELVVVAVRDIASARG
jgi:hypothetical protein